MSEPTPGPWEAINESNTSAVRAESGTVARMQWWDSSNRPINSREVYANARLIAAAPDLLEACEGAMEAFRKNLAMAAYKNEHVMLDAFRKCEDAVAKAKGE